MGEWLGMKEMSGKLLCAISDAYLFLNLPNPLGYEPVCLAENGSDTVEELNVASDNQSLDSEYLRFKLNDPTIMR